MANGPGNLFVLLGLGIAGILLITKKLKKAVKPDFGAFVGRLQLLPPPPPPPPKAPHPLTGLTFAVSDVFDIEGSITGFGNLDWAKTHEPASRTSSSVTALVEGGASCTGKTVIDDMAFGISGDNKHYEAPTNPTAPARFPGGSSSGAAVAVAASFVDFALGIDTVGGVRIPAAYCGILGFRPSYGTIPQLGVIPVASSLDTIGWFAKDPNVLRLVGHVLLQVPFAAQRNPRNFIVADDCFSLLSSSADRITRAVVKSIEEKFGRQVLKRENLGDYLRSKVPSLKAFQREKSNGELKSSFLRQLADVMQMLRRYEFKQNHLDWINSVKPTLDPIILAQLSQDSCTMETEIDNCHALRSEIRTALSLLLKDDGILVIPTTSEPPPKAGAKEVLSEDYQLRTLTLTSLASMSGCCQVVVPLGLHDKCPVSVSLIAKHGGDRFLLDTVHTMYGVLQEQASMAATVKPSKETLNQEAAEIAKEKGNQAFKEKQFQRAIGFYSEAIKLNSKNATYYSNRAAAYLEFGSFNKAEEDCTRAIDLDRKNVKAYLRRGTAREMLGYYREAVEATFRVLTPFPSSASLRFHRCCSSAPVVEDSATTASVLESTLNSNSHPWPEWVAFVDRLKSKGYISHGVSAAEENAGSDDDGAGAGGSGAGGVLYTDMNILKDACLHFARHRYDIIKLLGREEMQSLVGKGCPNLLRKGVNSAKRLRAYLGLDEGQVCSACVLRGSCDRANLTLNESEGAARTADLVRLLLLYALDPLVINGGTKYEDRKLVEVSARNLLWELTALSETIPPPDVPEPPVKVTLKKKSVSFVRDGVSSDVEMKRGDWVCSKCNFMNFSRNVRCRDCGEDGPTATSPSNVEMKKGDWICTQCNFMNFARNVRCLQCKTEGPARVPAVEIEMKKGDWNCSSCGFMNFASNVRCKRCHIERPKMEMKPGDWECPSCRFHNFRANLSCKKCNQGRPEESETPYLQTWKKPSSPLGS
ncbi:OLC1v1014331C1 [Oldenlandia corymbosa var. corymbosa]|uniref:OLC1v1014331C1 n=1 Tax=Oldenlandia corymbosa var. corymbosa TaxID=529605 RepID=A0AAV1E0S9_OLDCO|nr:OLC1v1014331C1 [Oldenlandia corymbosa var. corymbosa]